SIEGAVCSNLSKAIAGSGLPYRIAISTGSSTSSCKDCCNCLVSSTKGEPFSVHIERYASAERGARNGVIIPLTNKNRHRKGTSITRSSMRNSFRYFLTSRTEVESGDPKFINKIPLRADCFMVGNVCKCNSKRVSENVPNKLTLIRFRADSLQVGP